MYKRKNCLPESTISLEFVQEAVVHDHMNQGCVGWGLRFQPYLALGLFLGEWFVLAVRRCDAVSRYPRVLVAHVM